MFQCWRHSRKSTVEAVSLNDLSYIHYSFLSWSSLLCQCVVSLGSIFAIWENSLKAHFHPGAFAVFCFWETGGDRPARLHTWIICCFVLAPLYFCSDKYILKRFLSFKKYRWRLLVLRYKRQDPFVCFYFRFKSQLPFYKNHIWDRFLNQMVRITSWL